MVAYGNKEFLRSFQLKSEIKELEAISNNNKETTTTDIDSISLAPPFQTMGFLGSKWLEVLKELVDYGNKKLLRNSKLYLVIEEKREETKEVTNGILDIKREERAEVHNPTNYQNNNHNKSWFRPSLVDSYLHLHPYQHLAS